MTTRLGDYLLLREQIAGERVGPVSDVFSWAVTMAFTATGRMLFGGDSIPAEDPPPRLLQVEPARAHRDERVPDPRVIDRPPTVSVS